MPRMTAETARTLRAELAHLERATTSIPAFKARHEERKVQIREQLAAAEIEPEQTPEDPRVERVLRSAAGGDDLDGNRNR